MAGISNREMIKKAYPHSETWAKKVDRMPDAQVTAIFLKMKKERKI